MDRAAEGDLGRSLPQLVIDGGPQDASTEVADFVSDLVVRFRASRALADLYGRPLAVGLRHFASELRPGARVLDLGCGRAEVTRAFAAVGANCIGLDINRSLLTMAVDCESSFVNGEMQHLPFPDSVFDGLIAVSVLQYAGHRKAAISECGRVLKQGGRALFVENLFGNPIARLYRSVRRHWPYPPHLRPIAHIRWDERHQFTSTFSSVQFAVDNLTTPLTYPLYALTSISRRLEEPVSASTHCLGQLDSIVQRALPRSNAWCWTMTAMCSK